MLDRQKGNVVFECDTCGESLDSETGSFDSAMNLFRREGWKARKVGDVWTHKCEACQS
jgi:hypothetical protein